MILCKPKITNQNIIGSVIAMIIEHAYQHLCQSSITQENSFVKCSHSQGTMITYVGNRAYYNGSFIACAYWNPANIMRPTQNCRHFADHIFKCIFLKENVWILLKISLTFVPTLRINKIPALVQMMTWCRSREKPLSVPMLAWFTDAYIRDSSLLFRNNLLMILSKVLKSPLCLFSCR